MVVVCLVGRWHYMYLRMFITVNELQLVSMNMDIQIQLVWLINLQHFKMCRNDFYKIVSFYSLPSLL